MEDGKGKGLKVIYNRLQGRVTSGLMEEDPTTQIRTYVAQDQSVRQVFINALLSLYIAKTKGTFNVQCSQLVQQLS